MTAGASLHPRVEAAARGELPEWARASAERREHMARVAGVLERWARGMAAPPLERARWMALGTLHDALKDEDPTTLRGLLPAGLADLPDPVLHGPAVAERLRREGVADEPFLRALAYHTLGHAELDRAGRALYAADFLEPGRIGDGDAWRADLRRRFPDAPDAVVTEIVRARMLHLVERGRPVRSETVDFWNSLAEGEAWARASEV
jgi:2-amino-4-hydroxy-6-hydroxymethyldihydropteridine diphosphokinase